MKNMCGEESDEDGCGGEEKEMKAEAGVDGQCKCGLEGKGTVGRGTHNQVVLRQLITYIDPT